MNFLGIKKTDKYLNRLQKVQHFDYVVVESFMGSSDYAFHIYLGTWIPMFINGMYNQNYANATSLIDLRFLGVTRT